VNAEELGGDETWWQIYIDSFPGKPKRTAGCDIEKPSEVR
jgi:hypothetical protein